MTSGETEVLSAVNLLNVGNATGSYWSQILAQAICGARTGTELEILPSTVARWREWRRQHPKTANLLPPPAS
jgi:predicted alpha/beta hydrolase